MTATTANATSLEHEIGPSGRFSLRLAAGSVVISGIDGDIARVVRADREPLAEQFSIDAGAGYLTLDARHRWGFILPIGRSRETELQVEVPRGAAVEIETASGEVQATGLAGRKRLKTASGDLVIRDTAGDLDIEAVSGDVTIEAASRLDLRVRTISGDLAIRAPSLVRFEAGTTSGDIRVDAELAGDGPFAIRSISGDVTIVSRGDFQVDAQTITGDLSSLVEHRRSSSPGRKVLIVGRAGPTLLFKSVSGDLRVVAPRKDAAAETPAAGAMPAPESSAETGFGASDAPTMPDLGVARLEVLRALERGELTVDGATDRLAALAGPER